MYQNLEIYETDFKDKYLIKVEDRTMYVGFRIKEIIELLKDNKASLEILEIFDENIKLN